VDYTVLTDEALIERIIARDAQALDALYDRHAQTIYNLILRIVHQSDIADDLLQETFWQLWKKAGEYGGQGAAAAWLYRIARNKSLDQLRRQKARPQPVVTSSEEEETVIWSRLEAPGSEVETVVERRWERQQVRKALQSIPAEQRLCLELAYFEGMSQSQIADYTETPLGTIKTRIRTGMQKLERLLNGSGYE
jgi:RNA polymerase sigma-70 factor, ECF subfamily